MELKDHCEEGSEQSLDGLKDHLEEGSEQSLDGTQGSLRRRK